MNARNPGQFSRGRWALFLVLFGLLVPYGIAQEAPKSIVSAASPVQAAGSAPEGAKFTDETSRLGISFEYVASHTSKKYLIETMTGGAAIFDYDWRLGIDELGRTLAESVRQSAAPSVMIVAHSMGGLVARAALGLDGMEKVSRLVLLGTPNFGSYAPVQALRGTYAVVRKIARLVKSSSAETTKSCPIRSCFPIPRYLPPSGSGSFSGR